MLYGETEMSNPAEYPNLTDDALVQIVEEEHVRKGLQAVQTLIDRRGFFETAELLDVPPENLERAL